MSFKCLLAPNLLSFAVLCSLTSTASAATLNVVDGQLVGAWNVEVEENLYDVEFVEGTCIALFNGCDLAADFTFNDRPDSDFAAIALLEQVLLDGISGQFDTDPSLTTGCSADSECNVIIPALFIDSGELLIMLTINRTPSYGDDLPFPAFVDRSASRNY